MEEEYQEKDYSESEQTRKIAKDFVSSATKSKKWVHEEIGVPLLKGPDDLNLDFDPEADLSDAEIGRLLNRATQISNYYDRVLSRLNVEKEAKKTAIKEIEKFIRSNSEESKAATDIRINSDPNIRAANLDTLKIEQRIRLIETENRCVNRLYKALSRNVTIMVNGTERERRSNNVSNIKAGVPQSTRRASRMVNATKKSSKS